MRSVYRFWRHLIRAPKFKEGTKRNTIVLHKNKKTVICKVNIELEHISAVNRTKNYHSTIIFLCSCQYLDEKVGTSCPELSTILKILLLSTNNGDTSGWPLTWHNSADSHIRALDHQPIWLGCSFTNSRVLCSKPLIALRWTKPFMNLKLTSARNF